MDSAHDHSDPRMRKLGEELTALMGRWRELDGWWSETSRRGANDLDRWRLACQQRDLGNDKVAILQGMQSVDISFNRAAIVKHIEQLKIETADAAHRAEKFRPGAI